MKVARAGLSNSERATHSAIGRSILGRCGFSKRNPHEFIGGFERLAIACLHGDADKRGGPGRRKRTPNPHRAAVGRDRAAPPNCGARAQRNSSPVLSPLGSAVLDLVLALVAPMARQPDYCRAGDGLALAPKRLVSALAISIPGSLAGWAPQGFQ
jgi:hypothetical protein